MNRKPIISLLIVLTFHLIFAGFVYSETKQIDKKETIQFTQQQRIAVKEAILMKYDYFYREILIPIIMKVAVLLFGGFVLWMQKQYLLSCNPENENSNGFIKSEGLPYFGLTLIVLAILFLTANPGSLSKAESITPLYALFGTIVGYLLGHQKKEAPHGIQSTIETTPEKDV